MADVGSQVASGMRYCVGVGRAVVGGDRSGTAVVCAAVVRVSFNGVLVRVSLSADALGFRCMMSMSTLRGPC